MAGTCLSHDRTDCCSEIGQHSAGERRQRGFTLIELLVVIAIIAILVALLLPAVQSVREAARRTQCQNHLHNLAIAFHNYEGTNSVYPYGYRTPSSGVGITNSRECWFHRILPFIEQGALSKAYEGYYDAYESVSVHRITRPELIQTNVMMLTCPTDPSSPGRGGGGRPDHFQGNYVVCAGVGANRTVNFATGTMTVTDANMLVTDNGGIFGLHSRTGVAAISDGTSNTLMASEGIIRGNGTSTFGEIGGYWGGSVHGSFGFSTSETPNTSVADRPYSCKRLTYPAAPREAPCENGHSSGSSSRWNFARSFHPGGAQATMADGVVRMFSDNIDRFTWMKLGMMSSGLPVGNF